MNKPEKIEVYELKIGDLKIRLTPKEYNKLANHFFKEFDKMKKTAGE